MKKIAKVFGSAFLALAIGLSFAGCSFTENKYLEKLDESKIYANSTADTVPQTRLAELVTEHFNEDNGKIKKAIIIGYDGTRADSLYNIVCPENTASKTNERSINSGFNKILDMGGQIVLSSAGGIKGGKEKEQDTSTAPSWATVLTGKLADEHGVYNNENVISEDTPTILMQQAKNGKNVCFNYRWDTHHDLTYTTEINQKLENYKWTECETDLEMHQAMLGAIDNNTDLIFGIYENPDYIGETTGFGNENYQYIKAVTDTDRFVYELIEAIENRETYASEDWLIMIVADHGGRDKTHGGQSVYEKMIFMASNKPIIEK